MIWQHCLRVVTATSLIELCKRLKSSFCIKPKIFITEFVVLLLLSCALVKSVVVALKHGYSSSRHGDTFQNDTFSKYIFLIHHYCKWIISKFLNGNTFVVFSVYFSRERRALILILSTFHVKGAH